MSVASLDTMRQALTRPYQRGLETIELAFGATAADGTTSILPYDYAPYLTLYGRLPDSPHYLLVPRFVPARDLVVNVWYTPAAGVAEAQTAVQVRPGPFAGLPLAVPLPPAVTADLRLTRFQPTPELPPGSAAGAWTIIGVLGNLAKLLWVVGWEYDLLAAHLLDVKAQRHSVTAHGASLDHLGEDLGIRRFPAAAYSFDVGTIALYHLDDVPSQGQPEVTTVLDERQRYPPNTGHPAQNSGARSRKPGRFKTGFEFWDNPTQPGSFLTIADAADWALPAAASFTVEALVRPRRVPPGSLPGSVIAKKAAMNFPGATGWAVAIGSFHGVDNNIRFSVSDGVTQKDLFAELDLADGVYHHVAASTERRDAVTIAHLHVDGQERDRVAVSGWGAFTNAEPILIGRGKERDLVTGIDQGTQYRGLLDEIRLSNIARTNFSPVLGEGDDAYRKRLGIYERWTLPTSDGILNTINSLVQLAGAPTIDGVPQSFILDEQTADVNVATLQLRVLPHLRRGECIDSDGNTRVTESEAAGSPDDQPDFDPAWLIWHDDPRVDYLGWGWQHMMQRGVADALNRLLDTTGYGVRILSGFDPYASDLHGIGRALTMIHGTLTSDELARLAHRAGFDFVCRTVDEQVHVAQGRRDLLAITAAPVGTPPALCDTAEGGELNLAVTPPPPLDAELRWTLVRCGFGDGTLTPAAATASAPTGALSTFNAGTAGEITVQVEARRQRRTATGFRTIRIGLSDTSLLPGDTISGAGQRGVQEQDASGGRAPSFYPAYLVTRVDDVQNPMSPLRFAPDPMSRRMQRNVSAALDRLLATGIGPTLTVQKAYDATASDLHAEGRALRLTHTMGASWLAARAFAAGFDFVAIESGGSPSVHVSVKAGEIVGIQGATEMDVGDSVPLNLVPQAQPSALCFTPDGKAAFVADMGSDLVSVLQLSAPNSTTFPSMRLGASALVGNLPMGICATAAAVYVANGGSNTITVLDPATYVVIATLATGRGPAAIAARTDGSKVYVVCAADNALIGLTTAGNVQSPPTAVGAGPSALVVAANGQRLYVANTADGTVSVVDDVPANPIQVSATIHTGTAPSGLALSSDGSRLYVACAGDNTVNVYDTATRAAVATIDIGTGTQPRALAVSADGKWVYVACFQSAQLRVIDTTTNTLAPAPTVAAPHPTPTVVPVGSEPVAVAVSPSVASYLPAILVSSGDGQITAVDPSVLGTSASPVAQTLRLGSGLEELAGWSVDPFPLGRAEVSSTVSPSVRIRAVQPGKVLVRALYAHAGGRNAYQFAVKVNPAIPNAATMVVPKDQYDIVMNVLNSFHPIGVEVSTDELRQHVVEVRERLMEASPAYTYPTYRTRNLPIQQSQ